MTPSLACAVVCESATVDQQNRAIVYGIFSQIQTHKLPATHPQFTVFCLWENGDQSTHHQVIKLISPRGQVVAETPSLNFQTEKYQARLISQFNLIQFNEFGTYKIQIFLDGELAREVKLEVVEIKKNA